VSHVPVPWGNVVRVAVSIPTPLAVGLALELVVGGGKGVGADVLASIGGLVGAIAPSLVR
jgi:hypothetical protein